MISNNRYKQLRATYNFLYEGEPSAQVLIFRDEIKDEDFVIFKGDMSYGTLKREFLNERLSDVVEVQTSINVTFPETQQEEDVEEEYDPFDISLDGIDLEVLLHNNEAAAFFERMQNVGLYRFTNRVNGYLEEFYSDEQVTLEDLQEIVVSELEALEDEVLQELKEEVNNLDNQIHTWSQQLELLLDTEYTEGYFLSDFSIPMQIRIRLHVNDLLFLQEQKEKNRVWNEHELRERFEDLDEESRFWVETELDYEFNASDLAKAMFNANSQNTLDELQLRYQNLIEEAEENQELREEEDEDNDYDDDFGFR